MTPAITEIEIAAAEARIRKQGPCAFCDGPFARHRMIDAYRERLASGEPIEELALDFDTGPRAIMAEIEALRRLQGAQP